MARGLTFRQKEVLDFIKAFHETHGYTPTYREIGHHFGFSERCAYEHIGSIVQKGHLKRESDRPRGIHFVPELKLAMRDVPEGVFQKGDYVHVYGNVVTAITRSFEEAGVASLR